MTARTLLVAAESDQVFAQIRDLAAGDSFAGVALRPELCRPDELDARLRAREADALLLAEPHFREDLVGALRHWKSLRPRLEVLLMLGRAPQSRALVDLMRAGAYDVVDVDPDSLTGAALRELLASLLRRVEEARIGASERMEARRSLADLGLIGESLEIQNLFVQVAQGARLTCPVLISGEPGTGKRLVAHAIHALSPRSVRPVITVDCGSLSPAVLDAALFGGTRPGATVAGRGALVDAARRGTLLFVEIGEMPYTVQSELARLFEGIDDEVPGATDIRFLSTTSRRMEDLIERQAFRADLCYRLNTLALEIPPLRRRAEDIPLLARYFLSRHARDNRSFELTDEAAATLARHDWPGNVAELKTAIEYAISQTVDETIARQHLPPALTKTRRATDPEVLPSGELNLGRLEEQAILRALQISGFDKAKAARLLGIGKTTMYRKLKEISVRSRGGER
ncbi:MAG: sigma-54-dependent transcriptional regulator [Bryobacteraceae bacterium]